MSGYPFTGAGLVAQILGESPYRDAAHMRLCMETLPVVVGKGHPYGETEWPMWLSPLAFADWCEANAVVPPDDVLERVGLLGGGR